MTARHNGKLQQLQIHQNTTAIKGNRKEIILILYHTRDLGTNKCGSSESLTHCCHSTRKDGKWLIIPHADGIGNPSID
jgi:hypothetical protein